MESLFQLLFWTTLIWFFSKFIGNLIKAGEKKTKAKIDYLIGRRAYPLYIQEDEDRGNFNVHEIEHFSIAKTALRNEMTEEM